MARRAKKNGEVIEPGGSGEPATLGAKFRAAREAQGWAVEDVSRMLRLRPVVLRQMENDDLGAFTHASYARMSLLGYARLLGIPEEEIRSWLPAKGDLTSGEFTYLDRLQNPEPAARREDFAEQRIPKTNPLDMVLKIAAVVILLLGGAYAWMLWQNVGRLQGGEPAAAAAKEPGTPLLPVPVPIPVVEITASAEPIASPFFELTPQDSPTPFIEEDELALELQIPMEGAMQDDSEGDVEEEAPAQPEVRAALPALPVTGDSGGN